MNNYIPHKPCDAMIYTCPIFLAPENEKEPREVEELRGVRIRQAKFGFSVPYLIILKQGMNIFI